MPPETGTPNPDQQEKPKGFKEYCKLAWDSFWEFANLPKLGSHLLGEIPAAMKRAPILFVIFLAAISLLFSKGCDKSSQISTLKDDKKGLIKDKEFLQKSFTAISQTNANFQTSYQLQIQDLNSKNQEQSATIMQLIQARDKAQIQQQSAENALASWILLARSGNTNTPLTERLDLLAMGVAENTKSLTNALRSTAYSIPKFELSVNGQKMPNGTLPVSFIYLPIRRDVFLEVKNTGELTVDRLTIHFGANLDQTNLISAGWDIDPAGAGMTGFQHSWKIMEQQILEGGNAFQAGTLSISTNFTAPYLSALITVASPNSKNQAYQFVFVFSNP